jgi:tight adherence protein B
MARDAAVRFRAAFVGLVSALALSSTAIAADGVSLRPTGGTNFPDRAYVLSLPTDTALGPGSIEVRENGQVMSNVSIVPAQAADNGQFGVVLVLDASDSMQGDAIANAVIAARAFAAHQQTGQLLGVVVFNSTAKVLVPLTTDPELVDSALATEPELGHGTHIYDAVGTAVSMLKQAEVAAPAIIVLSDGADTGSMKSLGQATAEARDAGVRVFSVGLRSEAYKADALRELARTGGGEFSEAQTPEDLAPIFDAVGAKLASEYLIRYRSPQEPNRRVTVAVTVEGYPGAVTAGYQTPAVSSTGEGPFRRSLAERYVRSTGGMFLTALIIALIFASLVMHIVKPRPRDLRKRLGEFVSLAETEEARQAQGKRDAFYDRAERSFEGAKWWGRFKMKLDIAQITTSPVQIVVWTAIGTFIAVYGLSLLAGPLAGLLGFVVPFIVRAIINRRVERQRQAFAEQLPDNLQVLASALRAGHSLVGALSVVVDDAPDPSRREFRRVLADEQLGVSLEDALEVVAVRMDSRDVKQVALVAALQHDTGGNTAEVLDRVAETVRERFELRRLVRTLTAQGRMSRWVLTSLPIFLLVVITLLNPNYVSPLFSHGTGRFLLVAAAVMVAGGSLVIRRIINIKV